MNDMKFPDSMFSIGIKQLYDYYCLFAANTVTVHKFSQSGIYMSMSLDIMLTDAALFNKLSLDNPIYMTVCMN